MISFVIFHETAYLEHRNDMQDNQLDHLYPTSSSSSLQDKAHNCPFLLPVGIDLKNSKVICCFTVYNSIQVDHVKDNYIHIPGGHGVGELDSMGQ